MSYLLIYLNFLLFSFSFLFFLSFDIHLYLLLYLFISFHMYLIIFHIFLSLSLSTIFLHFRTRNVRSIMTPRHVTKNKEKKKSFIVRCFSNALLETSTRKQVSRVCRNRFNGSADETLHSKHGSPSQACVAEKGSFHSRRRSKDRQPL